jgi:hypothetical protein
MVVFNVLSSLKANGNRRVFLYQNDIAGRFMERGLARGLRQALRSSMSRAATTARRKGAAARAALEPDEVPVRPLGRVLSPRQFWDIMERWHVPDATALELIEFPGKLGKEGKRPRFRFTTRQLRITSYLPEIDAALPAAGKDQTWLHRKIQRSPFSRRTPIEYMIAHGMDGMADVLQVLNRAVMQAALAKQGR